ncbi:protein phosphatase CheZ [Hahella sp. SMD15-11]|uniref:Protein phosphatase CheZ n=1 Tax=Thermohahella caldifontis TaxID=3142973 RepID=A0AB39UXN6_9GAMM
MTDEKQGVPATDTSEFEMQMSQQAEELLSHIQKGDFAAAVQVIGALNETRDKTLYREVGRLTRTLHDSIRNFHIDAGTKAQREEMSKIADASDRLAYVVDMTNKAANKTLDLVEAAMPIASELKNEAHDLRQEWERLRRKEMTPDEFRELYKRIDRFLADLEGKSDQVYGYLSDILMAQDFQDLTGQVIQKVTDLVRQVEDNLVKLVAMAGKVDKITGIRHEFEEKEKDDSEGHGPQIKAAEMDDVVSGQDDVDDLLSSLGF